jgi:hypothetical protein
MTVYLGKNPVGVGRIVEKKVAKEKFGATVDSFLGSVDADGNYVTPKEPFEVNLAGVKSVPIQGLNRRFTRTPIKKFVANDLVSCADSAFSYSCAYCPELTEVSVNNLETVNKQYAFEAAFVGCSKLTKAIFSKLKVINANYAFVSCFQNLYNIRPDMVFPELEEISGSQALAETFSFNSSNKTVTYPKVKKITGSGKYTSTFNTIYQSGTVWNFPSATEFTGYIWNMGSSYAGEIHFAAANQAAIEACDGYANKWGFAGATIYFDL